MVSKWVPFGPGTVSVGATPLQFAVEVLGGSIKHNYADVGDSHIHLDGSAHATSQVRTDAVRLKLENDLTVTGVYQYMLTNDLTDQPVTFTPNTANGAKWAGTARITLPDEIGADEFGKPIISEIEWNASGSTGKFTFTPGT